MLGDCTLLCQLLFLIACRICWHCDCGDASSPNLQTPAVYCPRRRAAVALSISAILLGRIKKKKKKSHNKNCKKPLEKYRFCSSPNSHVACEFDEKCSLYSHAKEIPAILGLCVCLSWRNWVTALCFVFQESVLWGWQGCSNLRGHKLLSPRAAPRAAPSPAGFLGRGFPLIQLRSSFRGRALSPSQLGKGRVRKVQPVSCFYRDFSSV